MIDIVKQIAHWRNSALEDWLVAQDLVARGKIRHGLFFAHLTLEKTLKAHLCRASGELASKIHNLVRLSEKAGLNLSVEHIDLLAEVSEFNIEGRYPEMLLPPISREEADGYIVKIQEVLECLNHLF
jgi:HEPN domain-containing protein